MWLSREAGGANRFMVRTPFQPDHKIPCLEAMKFFPLSFFLETEHYNRKGQERSIA